MSIPTAPAAARAFDRRAVAGVVLFTLLTRLWYIPTGQLGFDGPLYVNSLKLDRTYNVPPPGNIGYVLLGKVFELFTSDAVLIFALVGTLLSCIAGAYTYLFSSLVVRRPLALAVAAAAMTSAMAWYHGVIMQSYIAWMAALPPIGYYGLRLVRERSWAMVLAASLATGLSTIVRPDIVMFGGPLLGACMILAWKRGGWRRAELAWFAAAAAVCAACCAVWFGITASLLGGAKNYMDSVHYKNEWHATFSVGARGFVEGLARNGVKYLTFMLWTAHLALGLAAVGAWVYLRRSRTHWRGWLLAAAWAGPSLYFSWIIFMGIAGLVLPALPLLYLAAGVGAVALLGQRRAVWAMAVLAAINFAQFTLAPLLPLNDQRQAMLNQMALGYGGRGIRRVYTSQLADLGIDRSLRNMIKQFKDPDPLPVRPAPK